MCASLWTDHPKLHQQRNGLANGKEPDRAHIDASETEEQRKFILRIMTATIPLYTCDTKVPEWQQAILNELFKGKGFEVDYSPHEERNASYTVVCLVVPKNVNQ
jgi:hypothetical protein